METEWRRDGGEREREEVEEVEEGDGSGRIEERRWRRDFLMKKVEDDSGETSDQSEKLYQTFQQLRALFYLSP